MDFPATHSELRRLLAACGVAAPARQFEQGHRPPPLSDEVRACAAALALQHSSSRGAPSVIAAHFHTAPQTIHKLRNELRARLEADGACAVLLAMVVKCQHSKLPASASLAVCPVSLDAPRKPAVAQASHVVLQALCLGLGY